MNNSKSARWSKGNRLINYVNKNPGPGAHETYGNTAEPNNFASQFHTILTRGFGSE